MSATSERDVAIRVAKTDSKKALSMARSISEPWFGCQALAGVARSAPDEFVQRIAEEAISAALTATDSYKRVAATAWPLHALIERNQLQQAIRSLPPLLALSAHIENPVSRTDALFLLWQAFFPIQGHIALLDVLVESCVGHWKADYILRQVALILASEDTARARALVAGMPPGKYKRQAQKRLDQGQKELPRQFFW